MKDRTGAIVLGIILILVGLFFLMQQFAPDLLGWDNIWPASLVVGGMAFLGGWLVSKERDPGFLFLGTGATLVGLFFFLFTLGTFEWADMAKLWPAFPVIGGVAFLALFVGGRFRDWDAAGVGCVAILVGVVAFGFTLFELPRDLAATLIKLWPLALIFIGLFALTSAFLRRRG